jgi:hypothetical protein
MATVYTSAREKEITNTVKAKRKAVDARISLIGSLDDEFKRARAAGNVEALETVAARYAEIGCPDTASRIRAVARYL